MRGHSHGIMRPLSMFLPSPPLPLSDGAHWLDVGLNSSPLCHSQWTATTGCSGWKMQHWVTGADKNPALKPSDGRWIAAEERVALSARSSSNKNTCAAFWWSRSTDKKPRTFSPSSEKAFNRCPCGFVWLVYSVTSQCYQCNQPV